MRYFFRLTDGTNELNPHEGIDLLGNAAAREEALRFAREIKSQKAAARAQSWDGWFVRIVDEHGKEIDTVPLDAVPDGPRSGAVTNQAGRLLHRADIDLRGAASGAPDICRRSRGAARAARR